MRSSNDTHEAVCVRVEKFVYAVCVVGGDIGLVIKFNYMAHTHTHLDVNVGAGN